MQPDLPPLCNSTLSVGAAAICSNCAGDILAPHQTQTPRGRYFIGCMLAVFAVQYYVTVGCTVVSEGRVMFPPGVAEIRSEKRRKGYAPFLFSQKKKLQCGY